MMNILEEAIIYATVMHQGKVRKFKGIPFILHALEVAQILSTMTEDQEIITAGILHDIVEDTDGTLQEIEKRFGQRVALLVSSESEDEYPGEERSATWQRRKEGSLRVLQTSKDVGVKMLWLADKLANIRSLAQMYSERGEALWQELHQSDPEMQLWYYRSVAEALELSLNKTGAFKELIKHINFIWPGTFDSDKARYRKYREVSIDGCKQIGHGAKSDVYRYDDELIIKVFNQKNTYHDVEREIALSRRAFILGIPTAISFGIVSVKACGAGRDRYGAMYELVDSETVSQHIARAPGQVETYAKIMAELAHGIHGTRGDKPQGLVGFAGGKTADGSNQRFEARHHVSEDDAFPDSTERLLGYIDGGIACEDEALAEKCKNLIAALPPSDTLIHGDFHTNNVFMQKGEPILIDMDRIARGHPIFEISDLYYFYVILGQDDPSVVEKFMDYSYDIARRFFDLFLRYYLDTGDEDRLREVTEKASLIGYSRLIRKLRGKGDPSGADRAIIDRCVKRIDELTAKLDTLAF